MVPWTGTQEHDSTPLCGERQGHVGRYNFHFLPVQRRHDISIVSNAIKKKNKKSA